jgi:hypothetical protein
MNDMMTPPTTETPSRPYSARLLDVLRLFDRCRGRVLVDARTLSGIGHEQLHVDLPVPSFLPTPVADALLDNLSLRLSVASRAIDGTPRDLPFLFCSFLRAADFSAATGYRHRVRESEQERVRAALAGFSLSPAFVIDAGPEVVAVFPLDHPLPVGDPSRADALLRRLAERVVGDVKAASVTTLIPLAGVVRNWNTTNPDYTEIIDVEPTARYSLDRVEATLMIPTTTTTPPTTMTATAPPAAERRKGARA